MKRISITYHMSSRHEIAETCATIAMTDARAKELLDKQEDSAQLKPGSHLSILLHKLAWLQGYRFTEFCTAQEVTL